MNTNPDIPGSEEGTRMKTLLISLLFLTFFSLPLAFGQGTVAGSEKITPSEAESMSACTKCSVATASPDEKQVGDLKTIPGTNESMVVGRVENLIPIGVLTVLGCEKCSAEAVNWALQQGSSFDDVERTLRTVATMQKLDCFKEQFGSEVNTRIEKPLAAAKEALAQARTRASK
jgi:hypothetical protein